MAAVRVGRIDVIFRNQGIASTQPGMDLAFVNASLGINRLNRGKGEGIASDPLVPRVSHPRNSKLIIGETIALLERGHLARAEALARKALQGDPHQASGHNILGCILSRLGRSGEAETSFRRATEYAPSYTDAQMNLGNTLLQLGREKEADSCFRQVLSTQPSFADALYYRGVALSRHGCFEAAEVCYRRVLAIDADHVQALVGTSWAQADRGHFVAAEETLRRALLLAPKNPLAWASIVGLRKMTTEDADWLTTANAILREGLSPPEEVPVRYAMGKYCDDVGEFDQAFDHYRRANKLSRALSTSKYYPNKETYQVSEAIRVYNKNRMDERQDGASDSTRPVFIVGMPRSGTTLVEQIIASHPSTFGAGELTFWNDVINDRRVFSSTESKGRPALGKVAQEYLQLLSRRSPEAERVVDKMPDNFVHLGLIHAAFPNARIIHTHRNPIDTCLSIYFQNFASDHAYANDLHNLAHYYGEYHRLLAHWRSVLPRHLFLDIAYEALVNDPEAWTRRLVEFIGLEFDARCLQFHRTERRVSTASNWQVRQRLYRSSVGRWRNYERFVFPLKRLLDLRP